MRKCGWLIAHGVVFALLAASCGFAQTINLWPGVAPGSEKWTYKESSINVPGTGTVVFGVTTPTLTAYLPDKSNATGTAVIIAPGGAFVALAMDIEGKQVAEWLNERGIAAFVLKYRIMEKKGEGLPKDMNWDEAAKYGIADGVQAIKLVRQHAAEWGVSPDRVVFVGFSAGAMVTSGVLLQEDGALRPNYAAPIYGAPFGVMPKIPKTLPPVFMAWAQDDPLVLSYVTKFYSALMEAGHKPEAHIYMAGGHGFGMRTPGATSDHWIDEFYWWLQAQGLTKPVAVQQH
jgi:acetyl esterase/lipase